jgi:hypothetical protein
MKLRIRGDSIRLRLTRGEVDDLVATGAVEELTRLPAGPGFRYRLRADPSVDAVTATFEAGTLGVAVPRTAAAAWAASEEVAIRGEAPVAGGTLTVLVEKDFPCMTVREGEDDGDAFAPDRLAAGPC